MHRELVLWTLTDIKIWGCWRPLCKMGSYLPTTGIYILIYFNISLDYLLYQKQWKCYVNGFIIILMRKEWPNSLYMFSLDKTFIQNILNQIQWNPQMQNPWVQRINCNHFGTGRNPRKFALSLKLAHRRHLAAPWSPLVYLSLWFKCWCQAGLVLTVGGLPIL
jgi:hypothetical protein